MCHLHVNHPVIRGLREELEILTVGKSEGIHIIRNGLAAPVGDGERLLHMSRMPCKEFPQVRVGSSVEFENILSRIPDEEYLQSRNRFQQAVKDDVVELRQILGLIDRNDGDFLPDPLPETGIVREGVQEEREDVLYGDYLQRILYLADRIVEIVGDSFRFRLQAVHDHFPGRPPFIGMLDVLRQFPQFLLVEDNLVELVVTGLEHPVAERMDGAVEHGMLLVDSGFTEFLVETFTELPCSGVGVRQRDDSLWLRSRVDDMNELACKHVRLACPRARADKNDVSGAEDGVKLLLIQSGEIVLF